MANPNLGNWAQVRLSFAQVHSSKLAESLSSLQLSSQRVSSSLLRVPIHLSDLDRDKPQTNCSSDNAEPQEVWG